MGNLIQLTSSPAPVRKPEWLKGRLPAHENYFELKNLMRGLALHTVCESPHSPIIGEFLSHRTATFMILGDQCTRRCGFCAVPKGRPQGGGGWGGADRGGGGAA